MIFKSCRTEYLSSLQLSIRQQLLKNNQSIVVVDYKGK